MNGNMHSYSINTKERMNILFFLALVSVGLSFGFYKIFIHFKIVLPWWVETPSAFFFYGLLFVIFDKWVWKFFTKIGFIKTPNLNGKWNGYLKSSFDKHLSEIKATLTIFQTWTRIKILLDTEYSLSRSEGASIVIDVPGEIHLSYQYLNEPRANAVETMSIHRGTTRLLFNEKENTFTGEYYSGRDRQNFGSLYFKRD